MTDKKIKIIIISSAVLVLLATLIPLAIFIFGSKDADIPKTVEKEPGVTLPLSPLPEKEEEMRGLWIATVNNLNFPSKKGLSEGELRAEIENIVNFAAENGFNTILFQVRPCSDALYKSELFPSSKFVSGECGKAPDQNFDCLGYLLDVAHSRQIDVFAWVNPLRITAGNAAYPQTDISDLPKSSPAYKYSEYVIEYADGKLYFDAGEPKVRELVASGVREICQNYDVDGIVFDDYFYPYPVSGAVFDDSASYARYGGEYSDIGDYRRDNINKLVELCYNTVKEVDKDISFGVSPFGIWRNISSSSLGSRTSGLEAYSAIYCDALAFAKGGYVDFIAPQLYWTFETNAAPFGTLAKWWNEAIEGTGVTLYINHGVYRYAENSMPSGELVKQVEFSRELSEYGGGFYYGYAALYTNSGGVRDEMKEAFALAEP